jgi:hypothetical protein
MIRKEEKIILQAAAICLKPLLKPEESMVYLNCGDTELLRKAKEKGVRKTSGGYYKRSDLDFIGGLHEETRLEEKIDGHMKRLKNKLSDKFNGF